MSDYSIIAILTLLVIGLASVIMLLTHVIMPRIPFFPVPARSGTVKDTAYESGVAPIGDARRRFNVRFYLVAVLFLLFDVEIIFLYPWSVLYPRLTDMNYQQWAQPLIAAGYTPGFFLATAPIFFTILAVGFVYEWRKGIFKWD